MFKFREFCRGDNESLKSLSRVRGYLGVMFLSDITTADGKHIEQFALISLQ